MTSEVAATPSSNSSADINAVSSAGEGQTAGSALLTRPANETSAVTAVPHLNVDSPLAGLPLQLDVTVPIPYFRVGDLLALQKGVVLETAWSHTEDVPVWCGESQLAWTEFEVVDEKLAVRITRIS